MSNSYEIIDYNLNDNEKNILKEINKCEDESRVLNKNYLETKNKMKSTRTKTLDVPKLEGELKNIQFAHGAIMRKRNKLQEQLYGNVS